MGGFGGGRRQARDEGGEDIQREVHISFAESFSGVKKEVHFDKMTHCESCNGHGTKDGKEQKNVTLVTVLDMSHGRPEVYLGSCNKQLCVMSVVEHDQKSIILAVNVMVSAE
jgi:hypothetical protein